MYDTTEYEMVKEETLDGIIRYCKFGVPVGGFLEAVLSNDLRGAFAKADGDNCENLFHIVKFCYNEIPMAAWGSKQKYEAWLKMRRDERNVNTPSGGNLGERGIGG